MTNLIKKRLVLFEVFETFAERVSVKFLDSGKDVSDHSRNDVEDPDSDRKSRKNSEREGRLLAGLEGGRHDQDGARFQRESQADLKIGILSKFVLMGTSDLLKNGNIMGMESLSLRYGV